MARTHREVDDFTTYHEIKTGAKIKNFTVTGNRCRRIASKSSPIMHECECMCGTIKWFTTHNIFYNKIPESCGCLRRKNSHMNDPAYRIWASMKDRCLNSKGAAYSYYGAKGIRVCQEWQKSFKKFIEDVGPRPTMNHSLDRIDVKGNYCKENCRWATMLEQNLNKGNSCKITYDGVTYPIVEFAEKFNLNINTLKGWYHAKRIPEYLERKLGR